MTLIRVLLPVLAVVLGVSGYTPSVEEPEPVRVQSEPILVPVTLADLLRETSWPESEWETVEAVAWCESRLDPFVVGDDGLAYGLLQIRVDYHPRKAERYDLLDPLENLEAGYEVWVQAGRSYWPWSCAR